MKTQLLVGTIAVMAMVGSGLAAAPDHNNWTAVGIDEADQVRGAACGYGVGGVVSYCDSKKHMATLPRNRCLGKGSGSSSAAGNTHQEYIPDCPCGATTQKIVKSCSGTTTATTTTISVP